MLRVVSSRMLARLTNSHWPFSGISFSTFPDASRNCRLGAPSVPTLSTIRSRPSGSFRMSAAERSPLRPRNNRAWRLPPALQEIFRRRLLLLFGKVAILFHQLHKRLKPIIRLIHDPDERTLALFILISFDDHDLILLVVIKAKMAIAGNLAILPLLPAPDKTPVLRAFIIVEDHPRYLAAVRMWILLGLEDPPWSTRRIRDNHSQSAIRFHDVDSLRIDLVKRLFTRSRRLRAQKNRRHKNRGQYH